MFIAMAAWEKQDIFNKKAPAITAGAQLTTIV